MSKKQTKKTTQTQKTTPAKNAKAKPKAASTKPTKTGGRSVSALSAAQAGGAGSRLPAPGTRIQKLDRYGKVRCECSVEDGGIRYHGTVYRSLSAAAMAAAGDLGLKNKTQNGFTFWGLTKPASRSGDPVEALQRAWVRYQGTAASLVTGGVTDENRAAVLAALGTHAQALVAIRDQVA